MENAQNKKNRIGEILIILLVLVCVALILVDMTTTLMIEFESQGDKVIATQQVPTPTPNARPTYPPGYTPPPILDS